MPHDLNPAAGDRMARAIARLRRMDRLVLLLSSRHRLGQAAVARRLRISPREARRRLARALRTLDRLLGDERF